MKKLTVSFICLVFLFCASACWAAYVILLKDGRSIITHEYWEEGDQIKIKQYGGVVGIAKKNVLSIEEADDVKTIVVTSPPERKPEAPDQKVDEKAEASHQKEDKLEEAPKEKNTLLKEFDALKKRFEKVDSMSKEEIFQLDKDLSNLRNKILKAGLGGAYSDHLVALSEMGNKAEEVYKKKNQ